MINVPAVLAGAAVGTGLTLMAAGWRRPPPDLQDALARLNGATGPAQTLDSRLAPVGAAAPRPMSRLAVRLANHLAALRLDVATSPVVQALRLGRLAADLRLLAESVELLVVRKTGYLVLGLVFPPALAGVMAVIGTTMPWGLSTTAALVLGGVLCMVPDVDVRIRAQRARAEMRRAVCTYLELIALERAAEAGAIEAIERAATIGDAPTFERIRAALTRAQLNGVPPWRGLSDLAGEIGVPELGDVADIMATSGRDGAAVYTSLRARAASLRTAITAEQAAAANAASERMVIPVAALGLVFMALIAFPAFARIVSGS